MYSTQETENYSAQEKDELLQQLSNSRDELLASVVGLSVAQASFKPSAEAWSVAGIVEHLAIVENLVIIRLNQLASAPSVKETGKFSESDAILLDKVLDRSVRIQTPERGQPTGKPLAESVETLLTGREKVIDFVRSAPSDFRQRTLPHPVLGPLDGHQWLMALAGHCARHTQQIHETKSAFSFSCQ